MRLTWWLWKDKRLPVSDYHILSVGRDNDSLCRDPLGGRRNHRVLFHRRRFFVVLGASGPWVQVALLVFVGVDLRTAVP